MNRVYFHPYQWTKKDLVCKNKNYDFHGYWFFVEGFNDKNESILVRIRYYPWFYVAVESNKKEDLMAVYYRLTRLNVAVKSHEFLERTPPYYYGTPNVNLIKLTFYNMKTVYYAIKILSQKLEFADGNVKCTIYEQKEDSVVKYHQEQDLLYTGWLYTDKYKSTNDDNKLSFFQHEILVHDCSSVHMEKDEETLRRLGFPKPSILSFDIECVAENEKSMPKADNPEDEVIMVCGTFKDRDGSISQHTITLLESKPVEGVELTEVKSEKELCLKFGDLVRNLDPDILLGHNVFKFDWKYLDTRYGIQTNECIPYMGRYYGWKLIELGDDRSANEGRYREEEWESSAYSEQKMGYLQMSGRIQMDLLPITQRIFKLDSYRLEFIAQTVLGEGKIGLEPRELFHLYKVARECNQFMSRETNQCCQSKYKEIQSIQGDDWKDQLREIIRSNMFEIDKYCVKDTDLPIRIFEKINLWINLIEDSKVVHVNIFDLYTRGQGIRVFNQEYKELMSQNYFVSKPKIEKRHYKGAFVFKARTGYYKHVHCLDFAKLYPSIMIAYNICYTTFVKEEMFNPNPNIKDEDCNVFEWEEEDEEEEESLDDEKPRKVKKMVKTKYRFRFVKPHLRKGVLPTLLERLANARDDAKAQLKKEKDEFMKVVLDKRQNNIKISMNSIYGNKGTNMAKLPLYEAAMCTTAKGRQLIHQTATFIESKYAAQVVYGDTDSVMFIFPFLNPEKYNLVINNEKQLEFERGCGKIVAEVNTKQYDLDLMKKYLEKLNNMRINYGKSMRALAKEVSSQFPPPVMLEYEKTFRDYLLVGKKMYAGMLANEKCVDEYNEKKFFCRGLPVVRRDNCKYLRDTLKQIFLMIFRDMTKDEVLDYILTRLENLLLGKVDVSDLYIYKKMGKEEGYKSETADMLHFLKYLKSRGEEPQAGDRYEYLLTNVHCKYKGEKYRTYQQMKDDGLGIDYMAYFESFFAKPVQKIIHVWDPQVFPSTLFSRTFIKFIQKTGTEDVKARFTDFLLSGKDVDSLPVKGQKTLDSFFKK